MGLPVNLSEVMKAATGTEEEAKRPISTTVVIDDTAPDDLIAHVRAAFAGSGVGTRVTIGYLGNGMLPTAEDDMAVIVAGTSENVGPTAAAVRALGVPVMVATTMPIGVKNLAEAVGAAIPDADVVWPAKAPNRLPFFGKREQKMQEEFAETSAEVAEIVGSNEPIPLNKENAALLNERMGEWVVSACRSRKLAFARAFPFVRRPLAQDAITASSMQNAAVGFLPIIPGADMPIMTLNQVKMVMQIASAYGEPLDKTRIKELAAVIGGAFAFRSIARSVAKAVPFAGWVVSGVVGFTGTEAIGRAAVEYFEAGGDLAGIGQVVQKAGAGAADAAKKALSTQAGQAAVSAGKNAVLNAIKGGRSSAKTGAGSVAN